MCEIVLGSSCDSVPAVAVTFPLVADLVRVRELVVLVVLGVWCVVGGMNSLETDVQARLMSSKMSLT